MAKQNPTAKLKKTLSAEFIPKMRELGFTGSLSNLRRLTENGVDVIYIHYHTGGGAGSFCIDLGRLPPRRSLESKTFAQDLVAIDKRRALGSSTRLLNSRGSYAFSYWNIKTEAGFKKIAKDTVKYILKDAVPFWADNASAKSRKK